MPALAVFGLAFYGRRSMAKGDIELLRCKSKAAVAPQNSQSLCPIFRAVYRMFTEQDDITRLVDGSFVTIRSEI